MPVARYPDGTAYYERTCATCFARITYKGREAEVMACDGGYSLTWCDHICAPRMRWQPRRDHKEQQVVDREIASRRRLVQEGRR